jgi:ribonuclease D
MNVAAKFPSKILKNAIPAVICDRACIMISMTSTQLKPPILVADADTLHSMVKSLTVQPLVAVDTESNSMYAYRERVCLIQFSIPENDFLVDPLAFSGLSELAPLFSDPKIEKIFHSAEYDIMCLKRDFGFAFHNLFDTRIASRTLGRKRSGLRDLIAAEFEVEIDKRYQRSNWGKRPLPDKWLDYARLDTYYLIPLRHRLYAELQEAGRLEEALEASEYITRIQPHENGFDPNGFWRIRNARDLSPRQLALLRRLYLFRDSQAKRTDRPAFKVMGDQTLHDLAAAAPDRIEDLSDIHGMTAGQIRRFGEGILEALCLGRKDPIPHRPRGNHTDDEVLARYEALHEWRKRTARSHKVDSDIVLPRDVLMDIAKSAPRSLEALHRVMAPLTWRANNYGEMILRVLWGNGDSIQ